MKVQLLENVIIGGRQYLAGWTCELTDPDGALLLEAGRAVQVPNDVKPKKSTMVVKECVIPGQQVAERDKANKQTNTKK